MISLPQTFSRKKKEKKNKYQSRTFGINTCTLIEQIINMHLFSHYFPVQAHSLGGVVVNPAPLWLVK